jgi:hypothetical protein
VKIEIIGKYAGYKLCYVGEGGLWFADCDPTEVWGDDFNDSPYEHNSGTPYNYRYVNFPESKEQIPVDFVILHFGGTYYETPAAKAWGGNSNYSVEAINHKHTAWLAPDQWAENIKDHPPIFAGTTVQEFLDTIIRVGGVVYLPHTLLEHLRVVAE